MSPAKFDTPEPLSDWVTHRYRSWSWLVTSLRRNEAANFLWLMFFFSATGMSSPLRLCQEITGIHTQFYTHTHVFQDRTSTEIESLYEGSSNICLKNSSMKKNPLKGSLVVLLRHRFFFFIKPTLTALCIWVYIWEHYRTTLLWNPSIPFRHLSQTRRIITKTKRSEIRSGGRRWRRTGGNKSSFNLTDIVLMIKSSSRRRGQYRKLHTAPENNKRRCCLF